MHSFIRQKKLARYVWWPPPVIPVSRTEAGGSLQEPGQLRPHLETPSNKQSPNQTKPKNQGRNDQAQMDRVKALPSTLLSTYPATRAPPCLSAPPSLSLLRFRYSS